MRAVSCGHLASLAHLGEIAISLLFAGNMAVIHRTRSFI